MPLLASNTAAGRFRKSAFLVGSFATLILLIAGFGLASLRGADSFSREMISLHNGYLRTDRFLQAIPNDMYMGGLLVRDYLSDTTDGDSTSRERQFSELRASIERRLSTLEPTLGKEATPALRQLREEVQAYWESLEPLFKWTPEEKRKKGPKFLRDNVLPRWQKVVDLAADISDINNANLQAERQQLESSQARFHTYLRSLLLGALLIGCFVTFFSTQHFRRLESWSAMQMTQVAHAEQELRRLSRKLVSAQEQERTFISRELHDALGQMITAQGLELSSLERVRENAGQFHDVLGDIKTLNKDILQSIRDLAMGLRPAMLDDIGLIAAVQWQTRQFMKRTGIEVKLECDEDWDSLAQPQSTCIYRALQEALTNCAKHSRASLIVIKIRRTLGEIGVEITDNGIGFEMNSTQAGGLGLLGMQERVEELGGVFRVFAAKDKGTTISFRIPTDNQGQ